MKNGFALNLYYLLKILENKDVKERQSYHYEWNLWLARSGKSSERYGSWKTVYSRFRKWIDDGIASNIFRILSLEAELEELSIDASIIQKRTDIVPVQKRALK